MNREPGNKFKQYFAARREPEAARGESTLSDVETTGTPSVGRRAGKRSDPAFEQVTAYIRKPTHRAVKIALLKEENSRQFSDLVEQLLASWLASKDCQ
jgi:hypothetical protein